MSRSARRCAVAGRESARGGEGRRQAGAWRTVVARGPAPGRDPRTRIARPPLLRSHGRETSRGGDGSATEGEGGPAEEAMRRRMCRLPCDRLRLWDRERNVRRECSSPCDPRRDACGIRNLLHSSGGSAHERPIVIRDMGTYHMHSDSHADKPIASTRDGGWCTSSELSVFITFWAYKTMVERSYQTVICESPLTLPRTPSETA